MNIKLNVSLNRFISLSHSFKTDKTSQGFEPVNAWLETCEMLRQSYEVAEITAYGYTDDSDLRFEVLQRVAGVYIDGKLS